MATGGWGAVTSGGAWGGGQEVHEQDVQVQPTSYAAPTTGAYVPPSVTPAEPVMQSPAYPSAYSNPPSPAQSSPQPAFGMQSTSMDASSREARLNAREAELDRRERELRDLEAQLRNGGTVVPKNNWPICFPITYHSISKDIPAHMRFTVGQVYLSWMGLFICLIWNFIGASFMLGENVRDKVASWFLTIIYFVTGAPLAWFLWYRRLYNGAKNDGTVGYVWFFLFYLVHIGFCVWCAIAVPFDTERWSFTGFVAAMDAFDVGNLPGIIFIVGACLWTVEATFSFWCLIRVYVTFRGRATSQPKSELALNTAAMNAAVTAGQR